jgi:hypothetical protein
MKKEGISIQEAAKLTGFGESTLTKACIRGEINSHKMDLHHWSIDVDSLNEYRTKHRIRNKTAKKIEEAVNHPEITTELTPKEFDYFQKAKQQATNKNDTDNSIHGLVDADSPEIAERIKKMMNTEPTVLSPDNKFINSIIQISYKELQAYGDKRYSDGFLDGMRATEDIDD